MKTTSTMKTTTKWIWPKIWICPWKLALPSKTIPAPLPYRRKITWNFSRWLFTLTDTPQLMLNQKWYQGSKPEMEFHLINIIYVALSISAPTQKTTFSCKDHCTLMKHTLCWTYRQRSDYCRRAVIFNIDSNYPIHLTRNYLLYHLLFCKLVLWGWIFHWRLAPWLP